MRVRFLQRTVYDTNGPGKGPVYAKDSVHDLSPDEAERWFRRGLAVAAPPEPELTVPEPAPENDAPPVDSSPEPVARVNVSPVVRGRRAGA